MGYLIMAAVFVAVGVALAIWVARERSARHKAEKKNIELQNLFDRAKEAVASCSEAVKTLEDERERLKEEAESLKKDKLELVTRLAKNSTIDEVGDLLDSVMKDK